MPPYIVRLLGLAAATGLITASTPAGSSSPDAWAQLRREAGKACAAATGHDSRANRIVLGYAEGIVGDRYYPMVLQVTPAVRGRPVERFTCLYDKRRHTAEAVSLRWGPDAAAPR